MQNVCGTEQPVGVVLGGALHPLRLDGQEPESQAERAYDRSGDPPIQARGRRAGANRGEEDAHDEAGPGDRDPGGSHSEAVPPKAVVGVLGGDERERGRVPSPLPKHADGLLVDPVGFGLVCSLGCRVGKLLAGRGFYSRVQPLYRGSGTVTAPAEP